MDIVLEQGKEAGTGLEALTEIFNEDNQANVIVCSALDEQAVITEAIEKGAKAFIKKPIDPEKLLETVIQCTDLRIIIRIGNMGGERAAAVLSRIAAQPIEVELPKLDARHPQLIPEFREEQERIITVIGMGLLNNPDCRLY
jgi:DNA-binding NarL/FixJ family response regulator